MENEFGELSAETRAVCLQIAHVLEAARPSPASDTAERAPPATRAVERIGGEILRACTDSTYHVESDTALVWVRHLGTNQLSMRCRVSVVEGAMTEDAIRSAVDTQGGDCNCSMVVSAAAGPVPCTLNGLAQNDAMSIITGPGGPVVAVAGGSALALRLAVVTMQAIWRVHVLRGARGVPTELNQRDTERVAVLSAWVARQQQLGGTGCQALAECEDRLEETLRALRGVRSEVRASMHDLSTRVRSHLGDWFAPLTGPATPIARRARASRVLQSYELSDEQRGAVARGRAFVRAGHLLKAEALNGGQIEGLTKYAVDKMFGNFTTYRKTVEADDASCEADLAEAESSSAADTETATPRDRQ